MLRQDYAWLPIFAGLEGHQIKQLSPFLVECEHQQGAVIFEQGQSAELLYILLEGEVNIHYKPYDGPLLTVAHIKPGGVFGWSAALRREVYSSGAVATQRSLTFRLSGADLQKICEQYPETGTIWLERLASVIAERLRSTHTQVLDLLWQGIRQDATSTKKKRE